MNLLYPHHLIRVSAGIFAGVLMFLSLSLKADDDISEQQLDSVRTQLSGQTQDIKKARSKLDKLQKQLKADEITIASLSKKIRLSDAKISNLTQEQTALQQQQQQLSEQLNIQQDQLRTQIQAAYRLGHGSYFQMLLSDPQAMPSERMISYYDYLNNARIESMVALTKTSQQLKTNRITLASKLTILTEQKKTQLQQRQSIEKRRTMRSATVKQSSQLLADSRLALEQLQVAEDYLTKQLKKQAERKQQVQLNGLKKNSLDWPVSGRILHAFGSFQIGESQWHGIVIQAKQATPVKAVADGEVVFADWMRGYGLVIAIDHGKDYLTLYGYNQELIKSVGDKVKRGDTIASVGDSGGQTTPSLYFQIRHQGKAKDPVLWKK